MPRRLVHDQVEVGMRKPVLLDAREEPEEGGRVGDVGGHHLANTTGEDAAAGKIYRRGRAYLVCA